MEQLSDFISFTSLALNAVLELLILARFCNVIVISNSRTAVNASLDQSRNHFLMVFIANECTYPCVYVC